MKVNTQTSVSKKVIATLVSATILFGTTSASAGFLDDFYNASGASVNVTPGQVYQTQTMGVVTGGSFVWKTPNKNFTPFYVTPPSLKSGCGGIDFFLGAFGMANKEQFVQFLRNVGQNAAGLAFKVALQAMAPELESKIQDVANYINDWNKYFGNSCAAAQKLMDSGPSEWIRNTVQSATTAANANGRATDYSNATDAYKNDSAAAISDAPSKVNSGGTIIDAPEINIVWSALGSGNMGLDKSEKELMMSLIGTQIFRSKPALDGGETTIAGDPLPWKFNVKDLVGVTGQGAAQVPVYQCDTAEKCLNPTSENVFTKPFASIVYEKAKGIQNAILNRTAPDQNDLKLLTVTTSVPIYKIINISTLPNYQGFGEDLLEQYSTMIAWEIASRYIEDMAANIEKSLKASAEADLNQLKVAALNRYKDQLTYIRGAMKSERDDIYQQINRLGASLALLESMQRSLYGGLSAQMAANMRFGR